MTAVEYLEAVYEYQLSCGLSRVYRNASAVGSGTLATQDLDWHTFETLIITPHPGLTPDQQAVIADDFGMQEGRLNLEVRRALKFYYLRMLHLDETQGSPESQQIVWLNRDITRPLSAPPHYD